MNDVILAHKYLDKARSAKRRGIEFDLPFLSFRNLMQAKKCKYTGLEFRGSGGRQRTIDRIDSRLGYVAGNVVAVCLSANQIKSAWENPNNPLTPEMVKRIIEEST